MSVINYMVNLMKESINNVFFKHFWLTSTFMISIIKQFFNFQLMETIRNDKYGSVSG